MLSGPRILLVAALGIGASRGAVAGTHGTAPAPEPAPAVSLTARIADAFDPSGVVDQLIRWRISVRDWVASATERLAGLAQASGFRVPDLTILTVQPLGASPTTWATSGFGWREDPIRHRRKFHSGADVRAKRGTPVGAAGDGVVIFTGRQGGYGNVIYVDHGGGVITRYAHLSRILVKKQASIVAGQEIGRVGSTGRATGPHLHFEVRLDGRPVDPGTAMAVAELQRESPAAGHLAAFALTPEMQALEESDLDPPKRRVAKPGTTRPERPGRTKRTRPVS